MLSISTLGNTVKFTLKQDLSDDAKRLLGIGDE